MNTTHWLNTAMNLLYTAPCAGNTSEFWLGLSSSEPAADGTGVTEPTGGSYARVKITAFTVPATGVVKNVSDIVFARSTGTWFDSTNKAAYWVLFDGSGTDANLLSSGELDEEKTIESNTVITIAAETLSITLTDYQPTT